MESIQILIREYMERHTEDVNVSLDDAVNILTATSKMCLKIKTKKSRKRVKATSNKKWFDRECRLKRHELRRVSNQKHRDPFNSELREKFNKTLTDYKKLLDSKRKAFQTEKSLKLDELGLNPNNASFWNYLTRILPTYFAYKSYQLGLAVQHLNSSKHGFFWNIKQQTMLMYSQLKY